MYAVCVIYVITRLQTCSTVLIHRLTLDSITHSYRNETDSSYPSSPSVQTVLSRCELRRLRSQEQLLQHQQPRLLRCCCREGICRGVGSSSKQGRRCRRSQGLQSQRRWRVTRQCQAKGTWTEKSRLLTETEYQ